MIIKTYTAPYMSKLAIVVDVNNSDEQVLFTGANRYTNVWAHFSTHNERLQKAIEKHNLFLSGKIILTEEIAVEEKETPITPIIKEQKQVEIIDEEDTDTDVDVESDTDIEEKDEEQEKLIFNSLADLQGYLQKNHQIGFAAIRSKTNAIAKADELGLNYEILK